MLFPFSIPIKFKTYCWQITFYFEEFIETKCYLWSIKSSRDLQGLEETKKIWGFEEKNRENIFFLVIRRKEKRIVFFFLFFGIYLAIEGNRHLESIEAILSTFMVTSFTNQDFFFMFLFRRFMSRRKQMFKVWFLLFISFSLGKTEANTDVIGCGGFIKSETDINYKVVRVKFNFSKKFHIDSSILFRYN